MRRYMTHCIEKQLFSEVKQSVKCSLNHELLELETTCVCRVSHSDVNRVKAGD